MKKTIITIASLAALAGAANAQVYSNSVDNDGSWSSWTNGGHQWNSNNAGGLNATAGTNMMSSNMEADGTGGHGVTSHTFTLSSGGLLAFNIDVGDYNNFPFWATPTIEIIQGGSILGTLTGANPTSGTWETWSTNLSVGTGSYDIRITTAGPVTSHHNVAFDNFQVSNVPEPSSTALLGLGALGLLARRKR